jgi:hypothetical protein
LSHRSRPGVPQPILLLICTQDQWQRKKQTKEEARNAKRAKLDPDALKTVKDVMDENARKRKRAEDDQLESDDGELGSEKPREGLTRGLRKSKKQKKAGNANDLQPPEARRSDGTVEQGKDIAPQKKVERSAAKRERKKAKAEAKLSKKNEIQKEALQKQATTDCNLQTDNYTEGNDEEEAPLGDLAPVEGFPLHQLDSGRAGPASTATSSPIPNSGSFDVSQPPSGSSSISSIAPSETTDSKEQHKPTAFQNPLKPTSEELKQRLQKRLDELRAARHADGFDGKPARNRQELIEARRQREEQRRKHRKELRLKTKEEEQRLRDEAIARRFSPRGSGSLLASPRSPADSIMSIPTNFSFGRVSFADGQQTDAALSSLIKGRKTRGPQDPATALKTAESKQARLAALDDEKRADIEEKDMWLNAKKRAYGERVKDDVSLLKKTLKRKQNVKKKSEREWKGRLEGVKRAKEMRQAKREDNLRKRKEEKGNKGKKGKPKARPGFEGSFKARTGGKKK